MKTISFVIPVYNEEKRIDKTFEALKRVRLPRGLKLSQIIFVDDGSTDRTFELIRTWIFNLPEVMSQKLSVISYKKNRGKGNAIKLGMLASNSDYTLFFDADMSTPLSELRKLSPFMAKGVSVIIGTRKNGHSTVTRHQPLYRELMGRVFTSLTQFVLQVDVTDFTCGFKAFSKNATRKIFTEARINGWGYDAEILFLALQNGFFVQEVAVTWANDERTKVDLKVAVLKTLFELAQVRWYHGAVHNVVHSVLPLNNALKSIIKVIEIKPSHKRLIKKIKWASITNLFA